MAKDLYKSYCAKDAVDRIKFDEDIVSELAEGKIQAQFGILNFYQKKKSLPNTSWLDIVLIFFWGGGDGGIGFECGVLCLNRKIG